MRVKQKIASILIAVTLVLLFIYLHTTAALIVASRWLWYEAGTFYNNLDAVKGSALVIAIVALVVAWNNFRRGNTAVVKLVDIRASGQKAIGLNREEMFYTFMVDFKNVGIPLRNVHVNITGFTEFGSVSVQLNQFEFDKTVTSGGTLEKGMVATFGLRSFELHPAGRAMLPTLKDPQATDINIGVYSNGYLVKACRVDVPTLKLRRMWNKMAYKINGAFTIRKKKWGREFLQEHKVVWQLRDLDFHLKHFIQCLSPGSAHLSSTTVATPTSTTSPPTKVPGDSLDP